MAKRPKKTKLFVVMAYDADNSQIEDAGVSHEHSRRAALKEATERAKEDGVVSVTVYQAVVEVERMTGVTVTEPYDTGR